MVRPTVLPSYRPNGRWDGSAVGHQAHAFHFLFEGVGRIYGSQIHGTQCRGPDIVCHGSRVLELADQRLVVGSPWRGPASWQAIGWHGWPLFETWQSSPWLGSVSFFFYFKQPSKLGLGPGLGQVVTWVRLVRVVAVTQALALRLFFVAVQPLSLLVSPMVVEGVAFEHQSKGARTGPIASKKSNSIKIFKKAVV